MPKIINCIASFCNFVEEFGGDIFSCDNAVFAKKNIKFNNMSLEA